MVDLHESGYLYLSFFLIMIEKTSTSTQWNDVANEWLIICPFCANEIREKSIRCKYCWEYLSKKKLKSDGNSKTYKFFKGCSDIIVWIFIIIVLGYLIKYFFVSNHSENVRSYEEMREDLTSAQDLLASKTDSLEMQNLVNGTLEAMDKFYESVQSIDSGSLYLDSIDYKNKNLLKKSIDSRNKFDSSVKEYSDDIGILFSNYEFLDDSWNSKYSLSWLSNEIKKFSKSLTSYKDEVVDFYWYILSIQDSFYVENDWSVYFYSKWAKMDKFNQLSSEVYNASIKYNEVYNDYMRYMSNYTNYWNIK